MVCCLSAISHSPVETGGIARHPLLCREQVERESQRLHRVPHAPPKFGCERSYRQLSKLHTVLNTRVEQSRKGEDVESHVASRNDCLHAEESDWLPRYTRLHLHSFFHVAEMTTHLPIVPTVISFNHMSRCSTDHFVAIVSRDVPASRYKGSSTISNLLSRTKPGSSSDEFVQALVYYAKHWVTMKRWHSLRQRSSTFRPMSTWRCPIACICI